MQPYGILLIIPLLVLLTSYHMFGAKRLNWRKAAWLVVPFGIHSALVLYQYVALNSDPVWASFTAQNITLSPSVTYYLLGYLPFLIPIAFGFRLFMLDKADDRWWMPIIWVALVAMLLYAPFPTQRRYLLGVQTPLAVMAAYGWVRGILPRFKMRRRPLVSIVYFAVAAIALIGIIAVNVIALTDPEKSATAFYQPDEVAGFDWLKQNAAPDDLLLTTFDPSGAGSGGKIVAATGMRVFIGH